LPRVFALERQARDQGRPQAGGFGVTVTPQGGTASREPSAPSELRFTIDGRAFGVAAGRWAALVEGDELRLDLRRGLERLEAAGAKTAPARPKRRKAKGEGLKGPKGEKPDSVSRPRLPARSRPSRARENATIYTAGPSGTSSASPSWWTAGS
jgi:hypothetical protein